MNDKIRELAEQAGFENGHQDRNGNSYSYELEKFAELIIQECHRASENYINECGEVNGVPESVFKTQFGIEWWR